MTRYLDDVTRVAFYLVRSRDIADDIAQRVFIWIWEHRHSLDPARPFKPYLLRAVHNRALDERKAEVVRERHRTGIQNEAATGVVSHAVRSPEDVIVATETLRIALKQLPERRRLALRLRVIDGMDYSEIAQVLGLSSVAARQLVSRAIGELRKIFDVSHK